MNDVVPTAVKRRGVEFYFPAVRVAGSPFRITALTHHPTRYAATRAAHDWLKMWMGEDIEAFVKRCDHLQRWHS
jgi:hypothetical protein